LIEPLLASSARVKLLCAPAGSGKSALLTECLLRAPEHRRVYWLPLSGTCLSVVDFQQRLTQALGFAAADELVLLESLARLQTPTWVFLDDYCRVPNPELDRLLDRLLAVRNPLLNWWLGSRRRPSCNWPRLLLDDELYECEARALAFNESDIEQLLVHVAPEQAAIAARKIIQRSGGWCAGTRIALLDGCQWMAGQDKQGRSATLLDYLQHELFNTLPPELLKPGKYWRTCRDSMPVCASICLAPVRERSGCTPCKTWGVLSNPGRIRPTGCECSCHSPGPCVTSRVGGAFLASACLSVVHRRAGLAGRVRAGVAGRRVRGRGQSAAALQL
jgi:hypothetical protein